MMILTTETAPGYEVKELVGYVKGSTIRAKHIGRDITAALKGLVGGEIGSYSDMMNEARKLAIHRMVQDAESKGANAIIAMRMHTSTVMGGAAEIIAYGTAVKIEKQ
ncbi:YbjQ family protein [Tenuibacillus multivorans]|uniref:UPF0145 protein SAMN05216498_1985 n=1 Tax=Tenuibacillus multivorans TaxID=237069 RepID=A0A1H0AKW9_9BACI|nr:YbjQ family protein [Tenuibacillus multivorans]GEL78192.1 UPF0145 protein [Tenuibacillus multivorans]SDN34232.1 Uncharacterized conserved protein YbjQ, UPF0145 family [Tenuibacillus multivorans]